MQEELPRKPEDSDPTEVMSQVWAYAKELGTIEEGQWAELVLEDDGQLSLTTSKKGYYKALPENFSIMVAGQIISDVQEKEDEQVQQS